MKFLEEWLKIFKRNADVGALNAFVDAVIVTDYSFYLKQQTAINIDNRNLFMFMKIYLSHMIASVSFVLKLYNKISFVFYF